MSASPVTVRPAAPGDAAAVARIYNEGIEDRVATFETRPRTPDEMEQRIAAEPMIVAARGGAVVGFASWVPYNEREAYAGIGEYTVYVARSARGGRIGTALMRRLVADAEAAGLWKLMSRILTGNDASVALAHRHGFRDVGWHLRHSRLDGEWRDVLVVELLLGDAAPS
ncbi:arsinothricin resistance N-acetyltransferase ArsN1 family A [Capillimicrobium parvum]|uniref:Phosphinothricin N-acetyltransferase n=1 Tax=Capillimicrobium parvum TaxID=2884022 RepID=A0A9E6XXB3_9ACTN|nr:arsinothricin resistance N-acetyltransferase ArsN1 family A [Capillimicrobium parvum]UGS36204.1 Phosphinothricin N-acetyltransferase [Capillimicrobium parvum]